jgi:hypothetical protein
MNEDVKEVLRMATGQALAGNKKEWKELVSLARKMAGKE